MDKVTKKSIIDKLVEDDEYFISCLLQLFYLHTIKDSFKLNNELGFNEADSEFMNSISNFYLTKDRLSPAQIRYGRRKIKKYVSQLLTEYSKDNLKAFAAFGEKFA